MGEVRFAVLCNPIVHLGRNFIEYCTKSEEKHFPIIVPHSTIHTVHLSSHGVNSESWKYIDHVVEMGNYWIIYLTRKLSTTCSSSSSNTELVLDSSVTEIRLVSVENSQDLCWARHSTESFSMKPTTAGS